MTPAFDLSKPVRVRDGRSVEIVRAEINLGSGLRILALVPSRDDPKTFVIATRRLNGRQYEHEESDLDFINVDEFAKPGRDIVMTRGGDRVWLLTREGPSIAYPLVGYLETSNYTRLWTKSGRSGDTIQSSGDLIL